MGDFIRSLAQILLSITTETIPDISGDGAFFASDTIFANELIRQTILTRKFQS